MPLINSRRWRRRMAPFPCSTYGLTLLYEWPKYQPCSSLNVVQDAKAEFNSASLVEQRRLVKRLGCELDGLLS